MTEAGRKPQRIQLKRTKGWRKPEGAIVVSRPSKWGNPYKLDDYAIVKPTLARMSATLDFRLALKAGILSFTVKDVRRELRGRDLCCWCPLPKPGEPDHCHAAVLLEVANA